MAKRRVPPLQTPKMDEAQLLQMPFGDLRRLVCDIVKSVIEEGFLEDTYIVSQERALLTLNHVWDILTPRQHVQFLTEMLTPMERRALFTSFEVEQWQEEAP